VKPVSFISFELLNMKRSV